MESLCFVSQLMVQSGKKRNASSDKIQLLELIHQHGSIRKAAEKLGISYRSALDAIKTINNLLEGPLIDTTAGGASGGGAVLTILGKKILRNYQRVVLEHEKFLKKINAFEKEMGELDSFMRRISLKTSARNQLFGKVLKVKKQGNSAGVLIELNGGLQLWASITQKSLQDLKIQVDSNVWALIKASWVELCIKEDKKSLNQFSGTIESLKMGKEFCEVTFKMDQVAILVASIPTAIILKNELRKGASLFAKINPENIILGIDE